MVEFTYFGPENDALKWRFEYMLLTFLLRDTPKARWKNEKHPILKEKLR